MGFTVQEIENVVHGTLEKEPHLAKKLIQDLEVRGDVKSLCYIPLVCSIVILVYRKTNGQLPPTLTELYENFILQTIRRHVKKNKFTEVDEINNLHHLLHCNVNPNLSMTYVIQMYSNHKLKQVKGYI